jgi:toxin YhaV
MNRGAAAPPPKSAPLVVNGWALFEHPLFAAQVDSLAAEVDALRRADGLGWRKKNASKRLAAIVKLAFDTLPQDPARAEYRQGSALGPAHPHWMRAEFFQQYRLFFRYHAASRVIVYAWVNDTSTLRAYESADDACRTFRRMLESGHPPDGWEALLAEAEALKPTR